MKPIGLYVHWPFCARICPYCDFTVAKNRSVDEEQWICALTEDLRRLAERTVQRPLTSVYFGGGTPSLMPARVAEAVLRAADELFGLSANIELTVEANPDDHVRFRDLRAVGFNRLSLGVQSFDERELRFLGRNHDAVQAKIAAAEAISVFPRTSFDFIYALPDQSLDDWSTRLRHAMQLGAYHLSLYQLTIEPGTAFGRAAARGTLCPMPDDRAADFYELTQDLTAAAGLPAYEVSNHARPGAEAVHNSLYWQNAEWLAIGPGAHGRLETEGRRIATEGAGQPGRYPSLSPVDRISFEELSAYEADLETLAGGLRPVRGLLLCDLGPHVGAVTDKAGPLIEGGLLRLEGARLCATAAGRLVLDQLTAVLAEGLADDAAT